jgi:ABC-type multidrug transport system ATPase subunit
MTRIEIRGLTKTYPNGTRALKGVDLDIPLGMFGLLGPNGAGKSTLMRTIATLQAPDSGSIRFGALDMLREQDRVRQILGYLPQSFGVYPGISAWQLLEHLAILKGMTHAGERRAQIAELLHHVNLYEARHTAVSAYSGGMHQRFGIAQALLGEPRVLIVDEPTAGLDPAERARFLNLLSETGERAAVVLSTHIVEDVSDLCREMAILADGDVVLSGVPLTLMEEVDGRIWRATIAREALPRYEAAHAVVSTRFFMGRLIVHVFSAECPGGEFEPVAPDLKDVYFAALKGHLGRAGAGPGAVSPSLTGAQPSGAGAHA